MPHIHKDIDYAADVFIVHNNKVLVRMHDKYKKWLAVGGHVELDEDPNEAAVREVKEEVGLDVELVGAVPVFKSEPEGYKELVPPRFMNIHQISPTHRHISLVFFARSNSDHVTVSGHDASEEWKWFTREELEKNEAGIQESIRHYALTALDEVT